MKYTKGLVANRREEPHAVLELKDLQQYVTERVRLLPLRSRILVERRFGLGFGTDCRTVTLAELARTFRFTRQSAYNLEQRVFGKLRFALKALA